MASGYTSVSLPDDIVRRLDRFLKENSWGYRSRTEVIVVALRDFLRTEADHEPAIPDSEVEAAVRAAERETKKTRKGRA